MNRASVITGRAMLVREHCPECDTLVIVDQLDSFTEIEDVACCPSGPIIPIGVHRHHQLTHTTLDGERHVWEQSELTISKVTAVHVTTAR